MRLFIFYFEYRGMSLEYHRRARGKREANRLASNARTRRITWQIAVDEYFEQQQKEDASWI